MFLGKNVHLGSELTKSFSSVRLLGVVMFRSRVKGYVNNFAVILLPHVKIFLTQSVERQGIIEQFNATKKVPYGARLRKNGHLFRCRA